MTGSEVISEIVKQMRTIIAEDINIGYDKIVMSRDEHAAMIAHLEETGAMPVMKKRRLPDYGCEYHGVKIKLTNIPGIKVIPLTAWWRE